MERWLKITQILGRRKIIITLILSSCPETWISIVSRYRVMTVLIHWWMCDTVEWGFCRRRDIQPVSWSLGTMKVGIRGLSKTQFHTRKWRAIWSKKKRGLQYRVDLDITCIWGLIWKYRHIWGFFPRQNPNHYYINFVYILVIYHYWNLRFISFLVFGAYS